MPKYKDIMLDLETLSLDSNAVIVSIGAVAFDLHTGETGNQFHFSVDILEQMLNKGHVSEDTLSWWSTQDTVAKSELVSKGTDAVSVQDAISSFNAWVTLNTADLKNTRLWGNGITADNTWIRNLYTRHGEKFILPYWCDNDVRTLVQLENYDKVMELTGKFEGVKHDAVADCIHQIKMCHTAYKLLKGA